MKRQGIRSVVHELDRWALRVDRRPTWNKPLARSTKIFCSTPDTKFPRSDINKVSRTVSVKCWTCFFSRSSKKLILLQPSIDSKCSTIKIMNYSSYTLTCHVVDREKFMRRVEHFFLIEQKVYFTSVPKCWTVGRRRSVSHQPHHHVLLQTKVK